MTADRAAPVVSVTPVAPRVRSSRWTLGRLERPFRATGATWPGADPRPWHGAPMEGWFWRFTDAPAGRVVVVLCGLNRHAAGDWATVAVATHPGGFVQSAVVAGAHASWDEFRVDAGGGAFRATADRVAVDLGANCRVDVSLSSPFEWPLRLGGGGAFSALPWLGQYWHPHVLGGRASGTVTVGGSTWSLDGADVYAEKNWGDGFPASWWWGQAQAFDVPDVCVAFGGGLLTAGPATVRVGGLVVRVGERVLRFTPPWSRVRTETDGARWEVTARRPGQWVYVVGEGVGDPHILPVPIPAERRNVDTDLEFLAGRMELRMGGRLSLSATSELAGLEIGHRPSLA